LGEGNSETTWLFSHFAVYLFFWRFRNIFGSGLMLLDIFAFLYDFVAHASFVLPVLTHFTVSSFCSLLSEDLDFLVILNVLMFYFGILWILQLCWVPFFLLGLLWRLYALALLFFKEF
jgi:hypothetical protein